MKKRETDYLVGDILEITDTYFHNYSIGERVKVLNKDISGYHVVSIEGERRWWWVNDNQVKFVSHGVF